ncbi:MAG: OsmC family protein [Planctomycetota bacterium]
MSSQHIATIAWTLPAGVDAEAFRKGQYSREHRWSFDGGVEVPASPSPAVVPTPWSNPAGVDPEEAFVAAVASCHMLTFLWLASKQGLLVQSYRDQAVGTLAKNENGVYWVNAITLHPQIAYAGEKKLTPQEESALHHHAHEQCFIANSVKTAVTVQPAAV